MQIPLLLDRSRSEAITGQLVKQLREAIRSDRIPNGTRLPSSRSLADQLGISRNTAVRAYDALVLEGYAQARAASGVFATKPDGVAPAEPVAAAPGPIIASSLPPLDARRLRPATDQHRLSFDFRPGRTNPTLFPMRSWRRHLLAALARDGAAELSRLGDPCGLIELRSALSAFLSTTRGMNAEPARIIITAGTQEALGLIGRVLLGAQTVALVEEHTYAAAAHAFLAEGAELAPAPLDADGLRTQDLPPLGAAIAYVTPSHQYPTGRLMPMHRRRALIEWAQATSCLIVEDDYDGDIRYEGAPLPALAGAAPDHTIHLGSLTTTLGAGLRLGYMVVPPGLLDAFSTAKSLYSHGHAWLEQATLARFIRSGGYATHLAQLRAYYRERRDALLLALGRHFGAIDVSGEASGLHLLWNLPPGMPEAATLETIARRARVGVYPLDAAGVWSGGAASLSRRAIVLGYGALTPRQIADGVARLSDAVDDRLDRHHDFLPELLVHEPQPAAELPPRRPAPSMHRRLALSTLERRRPLLRRSSLIGTADSMAAVTGLYRYPIKGLSPQAVRGVRLEAGRPFPFDRIFALARGSVNIDPANPQWAKKGLFVMLMLEEALAEVRSELDVQTMRLTVRAPDGAVLLETDLNDPCGRAATETFYAGLVKTLRAPPKLVRSCTGHFMDKPDNVISLINLATLRSLEERFGYSLDPLRFRANLYIDGVAPWEEFEWIGGTLSIGEAVLRVDRRNGRCGATNVDPWTGRRDRDLPAALRAAFGHKDVGVYLLAEQSGSVAVGDQVCLGSDPAAPAASVPASAKPGCARFICRGCYYVYDEAVGAAGAAPGTPLAALPSDWPCPDCGTDLTKFRAYAG